MKALQEKRISLRSLWRRSLVIFSVIALAFTFGACNQTVDPGNGGEGPPEPPPLQSTPISIEVIRGPNNAGGIVFEGLPVDLTGMVATVRFSDHTWRTVGADELTVYPPIYTVVNRWDVWDMPPATGPNINCAVGDSVVAAASAPLGNPAAAVGGAIIQTRDLGVERLGAGYTISFRSNNTIVSTVLYTFAPWFGAPAPVPTVAHPMGIHRPLLQVHYTGTLAQQDWYIDELPRFAGIVVEGVYWAGGGALPPLVVGSPPERPVWPGPGHPVTQATFVQRNIPISASIYPWAWIWNRPGEAGWGSGDGHYVGDMPGVLVQIGSWGDLTWTGLRGLRIPVRNIWQIVGMEIVTPPTIPTLFHDDPRFFPNTTSVSSGAFVTAGGDMNAVKLRWFTDVLGDAVIRVNYSGGGITREWTVAQLATMAPVAPGYWDGARFWSNLYFVPVDRRGNFFPRTTTYDPASALGEPIDNPLSLDLTGEIIGRWTLEANPRLALRFRGVQVLQEIPIFNRLETIEVVSRVEGVSVPIMEGMSTVYRRPDNAWTFLANHVRVIATYSLGSDRNVTATRDDVRADQHASPARIRPRSVMADDPSLLATGGIGGATTDANRRLPLLVLNMGPMGADLDGGSGGINGAVPAGSILSRANSEQFITRDRLQRASIQFMSESARHGDGEEASIGARQRTVRFDVGVRGYQNDAE